MSWKKQTSIRSLKAERIVRAAASSIGEYFAVYGKNLVTVYRTADNEEMGSI
jgi:hypothetical protein